MVQEGFLVFSDYHNSGAMVHVNPRQVAFVQSYFRPGAKPEDRPVATRLGVPGLSDGLLVTEGYRRCVELLLPYWRED